MGRGEKFCGDGERAADTQWRRGKGLTVHDALANPLACLHTPQCCSCVDWGMSHTATSPALPSPTATGNIPPLTSGTSGDWACGSANPRRLCSMAGARAPQRGIQGKEECCGGDIGLPQHSPHWETSMGRTKASPEATPGPRREIRHWFLGNFWADGRE